MEMNLQKYQVFLKVAECGSFTAAAAALSYSQSGVSRMVADLEKEWGVCLLERSRAGVRLTSDGLKLLPQIKNLCAQYQALQRQADELKGLQAGLIRIGTFSSVATHWLPPVIKAFQKDYPNIDYELLLGDYTEIEAWVREGRVDCGFLRLPASPELETVFLARDELLAIIPQGHPLAKCESFPSEALCREPFLLLERGGGSEISELFERRGLAPKVRFTTWDDYAVMSMVESGLGISILPRLILRRAPYRIAALPLDAPAYREIGLALRSRAAAPLSVKKFMEYLRFR